MFLVFFAFIISHSGARCNLFNSWPFFFFVQTFRSSCWHRFSSFWTPTNTRKEIMFTSMGKRSDPSPGPTCLFCLSLRCSTQHIFTSVQNWQLKMEKRSHTTNWYCFECAIIMQSWNAQNKSYLSRVWCSLHSRWPPFFPLEWRHNISLFFFRVCLHFSYI